MIVDEPLYGDWAPTRFGVEAAPLWTHRRSIVTHESIPATNRSPVGWLAHGFGRAGTGSRGCASVALVGALFALPDTMGHA